QTPWCIGLGSGGATGWPGTDWVEDLLLRLSPPEIYDRWVSNDLPFDAPEIIAAIEAFGWFARDDRFVRGGAASVAASDFRDSPMGLFSSPPGCYLHRQGSFITSYFPEGTQIGEDADFFYFPASDAADLGQPVLGAGTMAARMTDNPAGAALIAFLQTPAAHEIWMAQEGFVTPHLGANTAIYADDAQRRMGEIMRGASVFRFDGSDLMPGAIGAGAFWTAMVDYTSGKSAEEVAGAVQATWDALR
ncbi:MAG: alpha-glucoside ABC transporter substrate-binding protein, partial [Paracoccus sp. (in: a-proteobacteria)]|nr:alpha-glucoside ABC transporter substrate-binding protein [Paracoccus sp. (in: a-proteobacteria)]